MPIKGHIFDEMTSSTDKERQNCEIGGMGTNLHWPDIDEDLTVEGLVLGKKIIDWKKPLDSKT